MKVLITGVNGQLGHDVIRCIEHINAQSNICVFEHKGVDINDFDLTNKEQTLSYICSYKPDAVIHCAAYTAVDMAESNRDICYKVNVDGTANIVEACKNTNSKMIYLSTDYVFDGESNDIFEVDSEKNPINFYGYTKSLGEEKVTELLNMYYIVRTSWVFGINGNNFVRTMQRLGRERKEITVVNDQVGSPTYTRDLASLLVDMVQNDKYGIYHATNEGLCSWYTFAKTIMNYLQLDCDVKPITSVQYPTPAKRPKNSRLSKESLDNAGYKRLPSWEDALRRFISELRHE